MAKVLYYAYAFSQWDEVQGSDVTVMCKAHFFVVQDIRN